MQRRYWGDFSKAQGKWGTFVSTQEEFWNQVKSSLTQKNVNNHPLQMWFKDTNLIEVEDRTDRKCFKLGVPTELHKYWISQNLFDGICAEISALYSNPFDVEFVVTGNQESLQMIEEPPSLVDSALSQNEKSAMERPPSNPSNTRNNWDVLNNDHTFNTFVVGRNNEFAHAASFNIAENPGSDNYNPLFLMGPTGMGKTHLLNAVGNHIRQKFPNLTIMYVSAERFLNECISSIRRNEMDKFRLKYRDKCDILLMDDIQVLGRGEAVQEEFFHTLNDFFGKRQQVIVASDRMPKDIKGLEDRIRTRLEWGLIADIQMPDLETRVAILRYKAEKKSIRLPSEVSSYIAKISKRSIRELEGNLNKVKMFSDLQGLPISMEVAKKVLSTHDDTAVITIEEIQKIVADHFQINYRDLCSKSRTKPVVTARQIAMWLVKKHLDKSLVDIARAFNKKDHTTVMSALRKIDNQLNKDSEIKKYIEELEARIHNITGV